MREENELGEFGGRVGKSLSFVIRVDKRWCLQHSIAHPHNMRRRWMDGWMLQSLYTVRWRKGHDGKREECSRGQTCSTVREEWNGVGEETVPSFLPLPIARVIKVTRDNVYWTTLTIVFAIRLFVCCFRARIRTTFYCEYCADYFSKGISLTDVQMIFVTAVSLSPISLKRKFRWRLSSSSALRYSTLLLAIQKIFFSPFFPYPPSKVSHILFASSSVVTFEST